MPPFPFVRESLEKLAPQADVLVVSATPHEALEREWEEHDLAKYTVAICGQEMGTKKESLRAAAKYPAEPHADDRRRPRRLSGGRGQPHACSSPSIPARKRPVGSGFTRKGSTASSPARSPASIRRRCWPSSTAICPSVRRGRWRNRGSGLGDWGLGDAVRKTTRSEKGREDECQELPGPDGVTTRHGLGGGVYAMIRTFPGHKMLEVFHNQPRKQ